MKILIFLDYDGTLAPIAETPQKAVMPKETRKILRKILVKKDFILAVISGRPLKDIKKRVGLKKIIYVGNHGFEIEGPAIKFSPKINEKTKKIIHYIGNTLRETFSQTKGILVEDKGLTISLHYRLCRPSKLTFVKKMFSKTVQPFAKNFDIKINNGKKIFEIKPAVSWNKGKAVMYILNKCQRAEHNVLPIYIGDDVTDEDAFKALRRRGITIRVGKKAKSFARFYLSSTDEVLKFLKGIERAGV